MTRSESTGAGTASRLFCACLADRSTAVGPPHSLTSQLGQQALQELLRGSPGGVVKTQTEEVNRQIGRIEAEVTGAADLNARRAALATYLLPLATRGDERDFLIQSLRNLKNDADV